jgi:FKBP-type peptidyl-prolyl cis-trans isomerase
MPKGNEKQFDSSVAAVRSVFIGARRVIAGWDEGVTGMKVGANAS